MPSAANSLGRKLRLARVAKGLTLEQLAERAGNVVTKAALSKYERGGAMPRPTVLVEVARALELPASHFLGTADPEHSAIRWLASSKHGRLGARQRVRLEALAEQRIDAFLHLMRLLHPGESPRLPPASSASTPENAELAALQLRDLWGLGYGPIERLLSRIEDAGALVIESPFDERFDALSGRTRDGFAVIMLNLREEVDQVRFDLAHELGRLLLDCKTLRPKEEEQLAQRFAASFLVPAEAARHELGRRRTNLSTAELEHLERKYGISVQAWISRARDLGIITESVYREWQSRLRSQQTLVRESANYEINERPQRLRMLCLQALAERVIDTAWIRSHCPEVDEHTTPSEASTESKIQRLLRLPAEQRNRILAAAAEQTAADYENDPAIREWLELDEPVRSREDLGS
jgi:Zn-dependent peptidase ImmA (M78 family)